MRKSKGKKQSNCLIICHGKSEFLLVNHLKSNLRIPVIIEADKKGKNSIQINSLKNLFKGRNFSCKASFENHYKISINDDFKIFIIMDTDDCSKQQVMNYKNMSMFKHYWFHKYVTSIYNNPNIERVIKNSNLTEMKTKTDVHRIFPIDNLDNIEAIIFVQKKLKECDSTNMDILFEYLLNMNT